MKYLKNNIIRHGAPWAKLTCVDFGFLNGYAYDSISLWLFIVLKTHCFSIHPLSHTHTPYIVHYICI